MKKYVASVRDTEGRMAILRMEYNTKKEFKSDIRANGYKINYSYIFTEEEYEKFINEDAEFMAWFMERLEKRRRNSIRSNVVRSLRKQWAKEDAERLERVKEQVKAEKEAEEKAEAEVETAVEENRGIQILKESIAERKANGGDASRLEKLLVDVSNALREKAKDGEESEAEPIELNADFEEAEKWLGYVREFKDMSYYGEAQVCYGRYKKAGGKRIIEYLEHPERYRELIVKEHKFRTLVEEKLEDRLYL